MSHVGVLWENIDVLRVPTGSCQVRVGPPELCTFEVTFTRTHSMVEDAIFLELSPHLQVVMLLNS